MLDSRFFLEKSSVLGGLSQTFVAKSHVSIFH